MDALLNISNLKFNAIDFSNIDESQYLEALKKAIKISEDNLEAYKKSNENTFESVIEGLDALSEKVDYISSIFYSMYSAHATETLRSQSQEFSKELTAFNNKVSLDERVFERIKNLHADKENQNLSSEQSRVLEKYYSDLVRNGALLEGDDKDKLKDLNTKLSELSLKFSDNVLQSTNDLFLHVKNKDQLNGLPEYLIEAASKKAVDEKKEGFVFTLDYPVFIPFMKMCKNRELRKEFYEVWGQRGRTEKYNNKENIIHEIKLRDERSKLLGFDNHVHFTLEKRMAKDEKTVLDFIENLYSRAFEKGKKEFNEIASMAKEDGINDFSPWDMSYYSEKLKEKVLSFNDEILKPYFPVHQAMNGIFGVAEKLFNLEFKENTDLPKYHEEVKVYEVYEVYEESKYLGLFYVDLYPRETKKPGAWMTNLFDQGLFEGEVRRPHVAIVCNFTKPTEKTPSLLTLNEVLTLFHEFGHALHGLLSKCKYRAVSGTSVYWDFVELPSQIMENWVKEKECLDLFAANYETGEKIPEDILSKIKESNKFLEGLATLRQLNFAYLDIKYHTLSKEKLDSLDPEKFEKEISERFSFYDDKNTSNIMSYSFGHLFAGGYSSGYYSYKWAELLEADAFNEFLKAGIFNKEKAKSFKENILEKGDSEDPLILFKKFKGALPDPNALFERAGL